MKWKRNTAYNKIILQVLGGLFKRYVCAMNATICLGHPKFVSNTETFLRISSVFLGKCKYFGPSIILIVSYTE